MSGLKRSSSVSNIPRLSRVPVRQSNVSRARSSSARQSNVNNLLTVFGSGTMGRSSSASNLLTPSIRLTPRTSSSITSSAHKDSKIHDKDWQKRSFLKVKTFFHKIDPEMPPLKPITIRTYVYSMDILFKQIDNRISITLEKYKESVADYLKSFKYPFALKPSVVKSPAVPSSWPYVLQMWIWLIDLIESIQNPERVLMPQTTNKDPLKLTFTGIHYMAERFRAFNMQKEKQEEDVDKEFLEKLAQLMDIDLSNDKALEEEEIYLHEEFKSLKARQAKLELAIQEISEKVLHLRNTNAKMIQESQNRRNHLLDEIKEITVKSRNIQANICKTKEEIQNLKEIVSEQTHTKYEANQLKNKIDEFRNNGKHKQECRKKLLHMLEEYDADITRQKQTLNSIVYKINNKISALTCKAPELKDFKIPEEDMIGSKFECHIKDFDEKMKNLNTYVNRSLNDLKVRYTTLEQEAEKSASEIDILEKKITKQIEEQKVYENSFIQNKEKCEEQINNTRSKIISLEEESLALEMPDVDSLKRELENSLKENAELKLLQDKMMSRAEDLIVARHNNIQETIEAQKEAMFKINEAREKSIDMALEKIMK